MYIFKRHNIYSFSAACLADDNGGYRNTWFWRWNKSKNDSNIPNIDLDPQHAQRPGIRIQHAFVSLDSENLWTDLFRGGCGTFEQMTLTRPRKSRKKS